MNRLAITTSQTPNATIMELAGSADIGEAGLLDRRLQDTFSQGHYRVIIDLSRLDFTSSLGLGSLIRAHNRCRQQNGRLILVNPQPKVMRVFLTTRLNDLFRIVDRLDDALQACQETKTPPAKPSD
ncbi:MAG: STAS domain-containing protein [Sedimentisphaerales bacterium]|nr:STAS domain-containing protein [Sedimentisphaerales bacterium]